MQILILLIGAQEQQNQARMSQLHNLYVTPYHQEKIVEETIMRIR